MEIKLKSGSKVKIKNITLDERDSLLDSVKYTTVKGKVESVEMMHSTMTKWMRICIDGDVTDEALLKFTLDDRIQLFTELQGSLLLGEKKASK